MEKQQVNFAMPIELHSAYKAKAQAMGVSQTNLYLFALWQYIKQEEGITAITQMTKISDTDPKFDPAEIIRQLSQHKPE